MVDVIGKTTDQLRFDVMEMMDACAIVSGDRSVGIPDSEVHLVFPRTLIKDIPEFREGVRKDFTDFVMRMLSEPHIRVLFDDECGGCGRVMEPAADGVLECKSCKDHSEES